MKKRQLIRQEEIRSERVMGYWRFALAGIGAILLLLMKHEMGPTSAISITIAIIITCLYGLFIELTIKFGKYKPFIKYVSVTFELLTMCGMCWGFGSYVTFKAPITVLYFVIIALAAYRFSISLTIYAGILGMFLQAGTILVAAKTGTIILGPMFDSLSSPVVSVSASIVKIVMLGFLAFCLTGIARGYLRIVDNSVRAQINVNRQILEKRRVKDAFGKYVTPEIRDEILNGRIPLDGELKNVTVLFSDLRDFAPLVASAKPKEVVKIINGYFEEMAKSIHRHGGLVLQFIGDEIEAVFGAPLEFEHHPVAAARAALEMCERLGRYNSRLREEGWVPLRHGIGLHTGQVLAANIGSSKRLSYALVGDTVNLASRLQGVSKELGRDIILSASTRNALGDDFRYESLETVKIKGRAGPVKVFALAG